MPEAGRLPGGSFGMQPGQRRAEGESASLQKAPGRMLRPGAGERLRLSGFGLEPAFGICGLFIVMGVCGFHDRIIGPVPAGHVGKLAYPAGMGVHVALVGAACQETVGQYGGLGPGDGVIGPERAVFVAGDPAIPTT